MAQQLITLLRSSPVFQNLSDHDLERLISLAETRHYEAGAILFVEMTQGDEVFFVVDGTLTVQLALSNADANVEVLTLGPGEIVGEISLVEEGVRSATVASQTDVTVLAWNCATLRDECRRHPDMGYVLILGVAQVLARRIRRWNEYLLEHALWGLS